MSKKTCSWPSLKLAVDATVIWVFLRGHLEKKERELEVLAVESQTVARRGSRRL